jgi:hypothetical protein
VIGGKLVPAASSASPMFKDVGENWTSGRLADRYPNQIREKRSANDDIPRFTN